MAIMTPFDRLKTAWDAANRESELNRAVEAMAAEGITRDVLDNALASLLNEVRSRGADDETEEIINSVGDRLHGWSHPTRQIMTLPTEDELVRLPRWARVAFAARCARRVLPLFPFRWPDAPTNYVATLTWAVEVGERSAANAGAVDDWAPPAGALACAAFVCDAVTNANRDHARAIEVIKGTIDAVSKFKDKDENIYDPHIGAIFHAITSHVIGAIANHFATSQESYDTEIPKIQAIIRRDFDAVARLASSQMWTNDTPVPISVFGPMWPKGIPTGWPNMPTPEDKELPQNTVSRIVQRITHLKVA
ncbi:MAG TPA: hypothetical protein VG097_10310 [Gemmata sp.]|jgi:hypothetical protein|nr:hypothetical protein [Gemmata sp.]